MDIFRVRLNCIDHYQTSVTRYDPRVRGDISTSQAGKGPSVPVVRVFGSTETGQKVCAHIHGAFPYLYIEYPGKLDQDEVGAFIYRLHLSIDHALAVSYRRDQYSDNVKYVARITLVKGIHFYGFHVGYKFFLKIYMFNPIVMTRLADLLQQGVIMKRRFQPYEAHLQYLLQFMTDYNLYGCAYLDASNPYFRSPVPLQSVDGNSQHLWHDRSIPTDHITHDIGLPRVSHCSIEVDICVQDIANRKMVKERRLHHDFGERLSPGPRDMKLVYSMAGLWKDETRRRKLKMSNPAPGSSPFPADALVSMSADPRGTQNQGWIHEAEYYEEMERLIESEKSVEGAPTFDSLVQNDPFGSSVKTALESVEDLYPTNLMPLLGWTEEPPTGTVDPTSTIEVDEHGILSVAEMDTESFLSDSDEDFLPPQGPQEGLDTFALGKSKTSCQHIVQGGAHAADHRDDVGRPSLRGARIRTEGLNVQPALASCAGISLSCMRTGGMPDIPLNEELLDAAEATGLLSRVKAAGKQSHFTAPTLKRSVSLPAETQLAKRPKSNASSQPQQHIAQMQHANAKDETALATRQVDLTTTKNTRACPIKPRSCEQLGAPRAKDDNQTLAFPTVKSQEDTGPSDHAIENDKAKWVVKDNLATHENSPPVKTLAFASTVEIINERIASSSKTAALAPETKITSRLLQVQEALSLLSRGNQILVGGLPPFTPDISASLSDHQAPDMIYQDAYYNNETDVPVRPREYAGREFRLKSKTCAYLPAFDSTGTSLASKGIEADDVFDVVNDGNHTHRSKDTCSMLAWEVSTPPPSCEQVNTWWKSQQSKGGGKADFSTSTKRLQDSDRQQFLSQIDAPTPNNKHGFKYSLNNKSTSVEHEAQYMSTMSLEIHTNSRGNLVPNPDEDEVQCIFWSIKSDGTISTSPGATGDIMAGVIVLSHDSPIANKIRKQTGAEVIEESDELAVMVRMVEIVRTHDPDILTGYEVHGSSWGYLIERARLKYDFDLCDEFSRVRTNAHGRFGKDNDRWGFNTTSTIRVTGRHMINVWRAMRGELNLLQYTLENVAWHLLHRRIPHYSWKTLTLWYRQGTPRDLTKLLRYYLTRTRLNIEILEANELIPRTSEQARLLGVDFFSVFSRGSQYKVESIMFRIAKPENFMLVSPSRKQVGGQNALECLPLVMEPQSAFYNSPLLVLDFQSLYPSVMIAYNLCYSTFLGRIVNWRGMNKMGFTEYQRQAGFLELLKNHINITPNGMMYVKAEIRRSLLAKMLTEILETRVMVKSGMKQDKHDKTLQQLLNNRQLALKLLANVTYGYTSASFSGRMPCSEIADSIVQTGRETLERAIAFIHSQGRWGAEVVYGDTDSLFVYLKGRTRDQAFDIGAEIAKAITDMNPRPIKLKFEKVYHPCVLLAKKRYVGYKYESRDQTVPKFDAKGIETVRRDGTPAEQKIEEKALKLLFETADLSQIKAYFQAQCEKIMRGAVSVQDFCFAKEVKLGSYSERGPPPPGALISTKRMLEDARAEPQYGERVPYVVITGAPGARLIDRCVAPEDLLNDSHSQLDAEYYISKNLIPPLERILNLVGANVRQWYDEMPKVQRVRRRFEQRADTAMRAASGAVAARENTGAGGSVMKKTLESYMKSASCIVCEVKMSVEGTLCSRCMEDPAMSVLAVQTRLSHEEKRYQDVMRVCRSCAGLPQLDDVPCDSKDCPVFYTRVKQKTRLGTERGILESVLRVFGFETARAALEW